MNKTCYLAQSINLQSGEEIALKNVDKQIRAKTNKTRWAC